MLDMENLYGYVVPNTITIVAIILFFIDLVLSAWLYELKVKIKDLKQYITEREINLQSNDKVLYDRLKLIEYNWDIIFNMGIKICIVPTTNNRYSVEFKEAEDSYDFDTLDEAIAFTDGIIQVIEDTRKFLKFKTK